MNSTETITWTVVDYNNTNLPLNFTIPDNYTTNTTEVVYYNVTSDSTLPMDLNFTLPANYTTNTSTVTYTYTYENVTLPTNASGNWNVSSTVLAATGGAVETASKLDAFSTVMTLTATSLVLAIGAGYINRKIQAGKEVDDVYKSLL